MHNSTFEKLMQTQEGRRTYLQERLTNQIIEEIFKIMAEKQIKQAQLARIMGISRARVGQLLCRTQNTMNLSTLSNLLFHLGYKLTFKAEPYSDEDFKNEKNYIGRRKKKRRMNYVS